MIPGDLMVFFGILFTALNVMDRKESKSWNLTDKKE